MIIPQWSTDAVSYTRISGTVSGSQLAGPTNTTTPWDPTLPAPCQNHTQPPSPSANGIEFVPDPVEEEHVPADPTIAVGASETLLAVNNVIASCDKNLQSKNWAESFNDWFSPLGLPPLEYLDPWLTYDKGAGRFYLVLFGKKNPPPGSDLIFGISPAAPGLPWCIYTLPGPTYYPDYPKLGFNDSNLYLTDNDYSWNEQAHDFSFAGANLWTFVKTDLLSCATAGYDKLMGIKHADGTNAETIQPVANGGTPLYAISSLRYGQTQGQVLTVWSLTTLSGITTPTAYDADLSSTWAFSNPPNLNQPLRDQVPCNQFQLHTHEATIMNATISGGHYLATQESAGQGTPTPAYVRVL